MFESLQERLQRTFKSLLGQVVLNGENMQETLRELRPALLEADVNFKVVWKHGSAGSTRPIVEPEVSSAA
jgi:signal recognition particle GTPase